ncbi:hypothetical protein T4D_17103 [Trichinella pseudospiralis]|uniref:Uncharacterized protein n=1 Tax=Trichinella pseudospiralis TaxID=6337 RepID=A0A0V1FSB2_TRIPS|nr:hypothetical protein T4D_17103 [Trichinella pseudospiralis]
MEKTLHPNEIESTFQATGTTERTNDSFFFLSNDCHIMINFIRYNSVCHFSGKNKSELFVQFKFQQTEEQTVPGAFEENLKRKRKTCQPGLHSTLVDVVLLIRRNKNLNTSTNWHPVRSEWIGWSEKSTYFVLAVDKSRSRAFVLAFNVSVNERLLEKKTDKQPVVERSTNCRWPTVLYDLLTISESGRLCIDSSDHLTAYLAKLASIADASLNVTGLNEKQFKHQLKSWIIVYGTSQFFRS